MMLFSLFTSGTFLKPTYNLKSDKETNKQTAYSSKQIIRSLTFHDGDDYSYLAVLHRLLIWKKSGEILQIVQMFKE